MTSNNLSDILITFKSASNVPIGDFMGHNSDPYLIAHFTPHIPPSDQHPPFPLTYRTTTRRRTRNPEWNEAWHLGGIPQAGFDLIVKIYDEDKPGDFDDRLGIAEFSTDKLPPAGTSATESEGEAQEFVLKIKKRKASRRAYATTYLVAWCNADFKKQRGRVTISVQNLGKSTCTRNCPCVLGPMRWSVHTSPMIGYLAGQGPHPVSDDPLKSKLQSIKAQVSGKNKSSSQKDNRQSHSFDANKLQLLGTIPRPLRNKFVAYRPFIGFLFTGKGFRGFVLQSALHAQHRRVYCYDPATRFGLIATPKAIRKIEAGDAENALPQSENETIEGEDDAFSAARQFLEMVHYDEKSHPKVPGGRLYTYVITLQGEWRFTETGPEFAIQFLSKHSMHSDVAREVAFAGEFFVRRRRGKGGQRVAETEGDEETTQTGAEEEKEETLELHETKTSFEEPGFGTGEAERSNDGEMEHKSERKGSSDEKENEKEEDKQEGDGPSHPRRKRPTPEKQHSLHISNKPSHKIGRSRDPRNFVLIIDNDSGTYRPKSDTLPALQEYLERNLPGLKVKAMACDDERLKKWKEEQKPKKEAKRARKVAQRRGSTSSIGSSSDDDDVA